MKLDLLDHKELKSFPSGSGIEFYDNKIYLVGDDAARILVMNKRWKEKYDIALFESSEKRIPKKLKADLEATAILQLDKKNYLLVLGSGSKQNRSKAILVDLKDDGITEFDNTVFYERLKKSGVADLNIEGAAQVHDHLLLCNRANQSNPVNQFIITSLDFFRNQEEAPISLLDIDLRAYEESIGVSGITYSDVHDQIIFTTSAEATGNSYDDGAIGKSYLGIIENGYRKIWKKNMKVNELIDLPGTFDEFKGHKVESVCIQSEKDHSVKLQLVADDDTGESVLFKVRVRFEN